ncbi:MAG: TonB-dependent receptor [Bacteroidota bacterium]
MTKLYLAIIFLLISFRLFSQSNGLDRQISLNVEEQPLTDVLSLITDLSDIQFTYSSSVIPIDERISIQENKISVREALKTILKELPVTFSASGSRVILKKLDFRQTVKGRIVDTDTQQPIVGANVIIINSEPMQGASTDFNGYFKIENVPIGRQDILIKYLGYEDRYLSNMLVSSGKELVINTEIRESILKMKEVVITGVKNNFQPINESAQVSARSFSVEETKRYAASVGDPARLALAYPGVSAGDDGTNEIIIRGNSSNGLLWRLEGVEIPNPNHFSDVGASTGGISMFSTQMISRSDFLTGAFPSQYGNALSGVFDIRFRNGNRDKREYTFQAGLLGLDVSAEGPFKKGDASTFLFNYRYSTLGILSGIGFNVEEGNESNVFQDISFKVDIPTDKFGRFSVFGLGGLSSFTDNNGNFFDQKETYRMGVAGLKNTYSINNKTYLETTISTAVDEVILDSEEFVDLSNFPELNTNSIDTINFDGKYRRTYHRFGTVLNTKINANHSLELGGVYSLLGYNFSEFFNPFDTIEAEQGFEFIRETNESSTLQAYGNWTYRIAPSLTFVGGIHVFHFEFNSELLVQPRASLKWQFKPDQSISFGYGEHSRIESLEFYLGTEFREDGQRVQNNRDLDISKARHYVLGYDHQISDDLYFKTEFYYQQLFDIPVAVNFTQSPQLGAYSALLDYDEFTNFIEFEDLENTGTGTNYGVELSLEKRFNDNYYFMINSSVFDSKYVAGDGIERNSRFDGRFNFNMVGGKEFAVGKADKNIFGVNLKALYSGNNRVAAIDLQSSIENRFETRDFTNAFSQRPTNYFRADLQLSFIKNKSKSTHEWRLDIQNVTNRSNILSDFYNRRTERVEKVFQTSLIPVLSYRIQF